MKVEYQIKFNQWKEDLLRRLDEHLTSMPVNKPPIKAFTQMKGKMVVEVAPIEGFGNDGWMVTKDNLKLHAFFGRDAQTDAVSYANKVLNGLPPDQKVLPERSVEDTKSGEGYYDLKQRPSDLFKTPERCVFCGGYYNHREKCPGDPKLGPDQEPSGSK